MSDAKQAVIDELLEHLEGLTRESADIKRTINSLRRRMGQPPLFEEELPKDPVPSPSVRPGQFFGKPLTTAVRDYIASVDRPVSIQEVLEGLAAGDFDFDSTGLPPIRCS